MLCHKSHRVKCCYSDSSSVPRAPFISSLRGGRMMTRRPLTQAHHQHQHHQVPAVRFQYSPRSSLIGPAAKPAAPRDSQQQEKHASTRLLWGATSVSRRTSVVASASTSEPSPVDADRQSSHRGPQVIVTSAQALVNHAHQALILHGGRNPCATRALGPQLCQTPSLLTLTFMRTIPQR